MLRSPLATAGAGVTVALLPLIGSLALPSDEMRSPPALRSYLVAATALTAALAFWIVWHADRRRRPIGIVWLSACLLGSALLVFVAAPASTVSLFMVIGLLGAVPAGSGRNPGRLVRLLMLGAVLGASIALALIRAEPGRELLILLSTVATLLAGHRAHRQGTAGPACLFAAAALMVAGQSAFVIQPARDGSLDVLGHLYELGAAFLLYRTVLHQTLRQSLRQLGELANALQAVASPLLVTDADGRIRWVNAALSRATGYRPEDLVGRSTGLLEAEDQAARYEALHEATRAGRPWRGQLPVRRIDGSSYLDDRRSTPVHNDLGSLTGHIWVGDDVTESSRAEERLRHSEESLRRLVDSAPDAIVVTDGGGRIQRANPRVFELLGYTPAELEGMDLKQLMAPTMASRHDRYMQGHASGRRGMTAEGREVQALRKDGSLVFIHVRVGEMPFLGGRRFVGFMRDMTEYKRADAALRHSDEKLRKLYDMSPLGIALTEMDGRFIDFNRAFAALCGYQPETLRGLSYWDLTPHEYEADERHNLALLERTGRYGPYEKEYRRHNGELLPVRLNGVRIELDGRACIWSIVEDLTERRRADQESDRLQRQLMQAQKMEALGQLTGGIAHDFNNMLTGILGLSTLALERHVDDPTGKVATYFREIARVSERGRDLIERLMRFARPATPRAPQPRPLRPVVEEVLRMLESALPAQVTLSLHVESALPEACFEELDLHQVLTNLVINARDALEGGGQVGIVLAPVTAPDQECTSCGQRIHGAHVALCVRDSGGGIPPSMLLRIFDPFFTTKDVGKGTGLGLAMVHSLVHQAGGHVVVVSEPGRGTTFEVLLPVAAPPAPDHKVCLGVVDGPPAADSHL